MNRRPGGFGSVDLMLLGLATVWGVNFTVIKVAITGSDAPFTPLAFNAIRFVVAAAVLFALMLRRGAVTVRSRRDLFAIFGLGLLGNGLYQILFINGIRHTTPANSALILAMVPVMVALIGVGLRVERLGALAWSGIVLSFAGIAVIVLGTSGRPAGAVGAEGGSRLLGDALVFVGAFVWSAYTALVAPMLRRYSATEVTTLALGAGLVPLVLVALPDLARLEWSAVPWPAWGAAVFSGTLALGLGYVVWNRGVKHLGGSRTAVYSNLTPVIAALFAWIALGDALTRYHLIGAAAVLAGINLTRIGREGGPVALPAEE